MIAPSTLEFAEEHSLVLQSLRTLKKKIFVEVKKLFEEEESSQISQIEEKFTSTDSTLVSIAQTIVPFFDLFVQKVTSKLTSLLEEAENKESDIAFTCSIEEYRKLEEVLQQHEAENRNFLRAQLQTKLVIESLRQKVDDIDRERHEAVRQKRAKSDALESLKQQFSEIQLEKEETIKSTKEHLSQKNKEISSMHREIALLKKQVEDMKNILENQESSIKQFETQVKDLTGGKFKGNHAEDAGVNLQINRAETKYSSDSDLNRRLGSIGIVSNSGRNKAVSGHTTNSSHSSNSGGGGVNSSINHTVQTQKSHTPTKFPLSNTSQTINVSQNHMLSASSRGGGGAASTVTAATTTTPLVSNTFSMHQQQQSNQYHTIAHSMPVSYASQTLPDQPNEYNNQLNERIQTTNSHVPNTGLTSFNKGSKDLPTIKKQLLKSIKDTSNYTSLTHNRSLQFHCRQYSRTYSPLSNRQLPSHRSYKDRSHSQNTSLQMDGKEVLSNPHQMSLQGSVGGGGNISEHRSKSQQSGKIKTVVSQSGVGQFQSARTNSSLNQRNRNISSSTHTSSSYDHSSLHQILNRGSYLDVNLSSINATAPSYPQQQQSKQVMIGSSGASKNFQQHAINGNCEQNTAPSIQQQQGLIGRNSKQSLTHK